MPDYNARFAVPAAEEGTAFIPYAGRPLDDILCIQESRQVGRDNCVTGTGSRCRYRRSAIAITMSRPPCGCTNIPMAGLPSSMARAASRGSTRTARCWPSRLLRGRLQFRDEASERLASQCRHIRIIDILQQVDEIDDAVPPHRCNDAEFSKVAAQRIDQHSKLSHQQVAHAMMQKRGLLSCRLHRHEAHARSPNSLTDRRSVRGICLAETNVWLDVGRRDQPHLMPGCAYQTRPE